MKPLGYSDDRAAATGWISRFAILLVSSAFGVNAVAQAIAWPIATLQPPGFEVPWSSLYGIATTGEFAVTAYGPTESVGYRVFARKRVSGAWQAPKLVAQGAIADGAPQIVADGDTVAVGLPWAGNVGRVDIYRRDESSSTWTLEQSLTSGPPLGWQQFGSKLSLRNSLLVVASRFAWDARLEAFRRDDATGTWHDTGFNPVRYGDRSAKTDGSRIAVCWDGTCSTHTQNAAGEWENEGSLPGSTSEALADGEWVLAKLRSGSNIDFLVAYKRVAGQWQLQQNVMGMPTTSRIVGGGGTVSFMDTGSTVRIVSLNSAGIWQLAASVPMPESSGYSVDLLGGSLLISTQSFVQSSIGWNPMGVVDGIPNTRFSRFGNAVEIVDGRIWIGEPGHSAFNLATGVVWMQDLAGIIPASPVERIVPPRPAIAMLLGAVMDTDGAHVVVASAAQWSDGHAGARVYEAAAPDADGIPLTVPNFGQWQQSLDVAIQGDIVVLAGSGGSGIDRYARLQVFRRNGNTYPLVQTIDLPAATYNYQGPGGVHIALSDQWLLAGPRRYRLVAGSYLDRGNLVFPPATPGVVHDLTRIVEGDGFVVVPVLSDVSGELLGSVFESDPVEGWTYRGVVRKDIPDGAICKAMAASAAAIVCMPAGSDRLRVAKPDGATGNWRVVGSVTVPGVTISQSSNYSLEVAGETVAVGLPDGESPRVVTLSLSEVIFTNGYDG